jgi:hypothetical protein
MQFRGVIIFAFSSCASKLPIRGTQMPAKATFWMQRRWDESSGAALPILLDPYLDIVIRPAGYRINPARDQNISFRPIGL